MEVITASKNVGVGIPINDSCEPSVPQRIGSVLAGISNWSKTCLGMSITCGLA